MPSEWPIVCPKCLQKHENIHGMVYADGSAVGERCDHPWHKGPGYRPEELHLSDDDRAFLSRMNIGAR